MAQVSLGRLALPREPCSLYYRSSKSQLMDICESSNYTSLYSLKPKSVSATDPNDPSNKSSNTGGIIGGVVAGLAGLALIVVGIIFWRRRQRRKDDGYGPGAQESGWFGRKERSEPQEILGEQYHAQPYNPYGDQTPNTGMGPPFTTGARTTTSFDSSVAHHMTSPQSMVPPVPAIPAMYPPPQSGKAGLLHMTYGPPSQHQPDGSAYAGSSSNGSNSDGQATFLRSEVEHLRREMEEMRARSGYEPPPQYT